MDTRQQQNVPAAKILSERLALLRGNRSKRSFCKQIGVSSPQTYQHYENGRIPSSDTHVMIAERCGVTVDWLLGHGGDTPSEAAAARQAGADPPLPGCRYPEACDLPAELAAMRSEMAAMAAQIKTLCDVLSGLARRGLETGDREAGAERRAG